MEVANDRSPKPTQTTHVADGGEDDDGVVLSAQYVVQEPVDEILDLTETVVRKIAKKLCGDCY